MIRLKSPDDSESSGDLSGPDRSPLLDEYWDALHRELGSDSRQQLIDRVPTGDSIVGDLEFLDLLNQLRSESLAEVDASRSSTIVLSERFATKAGSRPSDGGCSASGIEGQPSVELPRQIGKYQVFERLGSGGQAQVFRVFDTELHRDLVLKLENRPADESGRSHIVVDGCRLAELDHPNIVRVHHLDVHEGRPYLIMEYIRGRSLAQYAREETVTPRRAAALVAELAGAVGYAHSLGIVHQDIKPQNVLIDERGRPRLIDFGLSRLKNAWRDGSDDDVGGTRAYMSPEQALGYADRIDHRTDVFGLGSVLYHLLTGHPLYWGFTPDSALRFARKTENVPVRMLNPGVPRPLARICHKALAAEPEDRYQKAVELERALKRSLKRRWISAAGLIVLSLMTAVLFAQRRSPPVAPKIVSFDVYAFRGDPVDPLGRIGVYPAAIHANDDAVRVKARFDAPAYCYLIALDTDGEVELCYPSTPSEFPERTEFILFPPDRTDGSNQIDYFTLSEGPGVQGFALVAAARPLPSFDHWEGLNGLEQRWKPDSTEVAWSYEGDAIEPLDSGNRGDVRERAGHPPNFLSVCKYLKDRPDVQAIRAVAFPVKPKK
jgi:serine/threonine protein kinase